MPYSSALDATAARRAISMGDDAALERYLREGGANPVATASAATGFLSGGGTTIMNRAAGVSLTLPAARGSQERYHIIVQTTFAGGNGVIKVANSLDSMIGNVVMSTSTLAAGVMQAPPAGSDTITLNGGTTGGAAGTSITLIDVAPATWLVDGVIVCVGAAASPFSNTV
jgi:hypothetical protein